MIEGVGHPLDAVLDEALGAAVDLLVEVVGVEGLEVLLARLADGPLGRQSREAAASRRSPLRLGHGGQLGLHLRRGSAQPAGRGGDRCRGRSDRASPWTSGAGVMAFGGGRAEIDRRRRVVEELLRAVQPDALPHPGQRLQTPGNRCATAAEVPATARSASIGSSSFLTLSTRFFRSSASRCISCLTAASACRRSWSPRPCSSTDQVRFGSNSYRFLSNDRLLSTIAAKIAGMPITSIMPTTIEENAGRCKTRPRLALNQSSRPRTANATGVVAIATSAAVRPSTSSGSFASSSRYWDQRLVAFIVPLGGRVGVTHRPTRVDRPQRVDPPCGDASGTGVPRGRIATPIGSEGPSGRTRLIITARGSRRQSAGPAGCAPSGPWEWTEAASWKPRRSGGMHPGRPGNAAIRGPT